MDLNKAATEAAPKVLETIGFQWVGVERVRTAYKEKHGQDLAPEVCRKVLLKLVAAGKLVQGSARTTEGGVAPIFRVRPMKPGEIAVVVDEKGDVQAAPVVN